MSLYLGGYKTVECLKIIVQLNFTTENEKMYTNWNKSFVLFILFRQDKTEVSLKPEQKQVHQNNVKFVKMKDNTWLYVANLPRIDLF